MRKLLGEKVPQSEDFKDAVAQRAIDIILERTDAGRDWRGKAFKKYSESYKDSDDFEAFGKSSSVNLSLTGDMLGLLDKINDTRDKIELGWEDETENAKAANHTQGVTVPQRDFLNLNKKELEELRRFAKDLMPDE